MVIVASRATCNPQLTEMVGQDAERIPPSMPDSHEVAKPSNQIRLGGGWWGRNSLPATAFKRSKPEPQSRATTTEIDGIERR